MTENSYKEKALEYYLEKKDSDSLYYKHLCIVIEEADKLKTRRTRLAKLCRLSERLVDGYLLHTYGSTIEELFPDVNLEDY